MTSVAYRSTWRAWGALLAITLGMVVFAAPPVLLLGMVAKASIIVFWFMHLRDEPKDFILIITLALFLTALVLYVLIVPDGRALLP